MFAARSIMIGLVVLGASGALAQESGERPNGQPLDLRPALQGKPASSKTKATSSKPAAPAKQKKVPKPGPADVEPQRGFAEMAPVLPTGRTRPASAPSPDTPVAKPVQAEAKPAPEKAPPFDETVIARFCTSLSTAASDGRLAWQAKRLEDMEERLRVRIAELEAKRVETAEWLKRREEAMRKAEETVVAIYSKMKPDAAAAQFSAMDASGAAAILSKLNPRMASTVLNEIDPSRAARIAAEMAGVGPRREARSTQ